MKSLVTRRNDHGQQETTRRKKGRIRTQTKTWRKNPGTQYPGPRFHIRGNKDHGRKLHHFKNHTKMIIYSNPYNTQKNIGKAYNDFINCLNVPEETWIVIQDGDIIYLDPRWGTLIETVTETTGKEYDLLGCTTNRVGLIDHLAWGEFNDDDQLRVHQNIATARHSMFYNQIKDTKVVAGYFMLFKYSTWKKVGGFQEDTLAADRNFSHKVLQHGGRLGIMLGLYVFHAYRLHQHGRTNAQQDYKHLKIN